MSKNRELWLDLTGCSRDRQFWADLPVCSRKDVHELPPPEDVVVQFWLKEADVDLQQTVRDVLSYYFVFRSFFDVRKGSNGVSVFAIAQREDHASHLHGKIFRLEEAEWLYSVKVHHSRMDDKDLAEDDMPDIEFEYWI